jgi:polysaccharide deacetylase 2 family uncharacterized protein YibQ
MMGTIVSLGIAGVASVMTDGPMAPSVSDAAPEGGSGGAGASQVGVDAPKGDADLVQDGSNNTSQPAPDDVSAVAQAGSDLSQQPETGNAEGLVTPNATPTEGSVVVDGEAPVAASPQADGPTAPESETELSISTDPAQPPAPEVSEEETAFQDPTEPAQPEAPAVDETAALPETAAPEDDARPKIGRPAGSLVGNDEEPTPQDVAAPLEEAAAIPPLEAFAVGFENLGDKPLMSIVLIDAGQPLDGDVGVPALKSFPAPISIAVDANLSDAAARMKQYRTDGFEVLAMVDFPDQATAIDAEVTLDAAFSQMTEVVGVLEGVDTGMQGGREASDQATQILLASGNGFVTQSKGLNTVAKLAEREGVPTATVFRDFDSADQSATVIRRFLDQAAFRAGQEGGVIMLGRLRPETISALLLWGLQDRASRVSLAPVSAVLNQ